jgi:polyribonucleotide nucleotidyltransferase
MLIAVDDAYTTALLTHATATLCTAYLQVVGWVIGRSGSHIKEMKHRTGCGMWVDQKDLKLYITGSDMPRIHHAAAMVGDLISKVRCVNRLLYTL